MKFRAAAFLLLFPLLFSTLANAAPGDDLILSGRDAARSGDRVRFVPQKEGVC